MTKQLSTENGTDLACRVAAFGAIRRAAAWARYADAEATRPFPINPPQTEEEARLRLLPAKAIRKAIRAAIKSEKP
jgi:hypothetical protein